MSLLARLKRRNVFRVVIFYIVSNPTPNGRCREGQKRISAVVECP